VTATPQVAAHAEPLWFLGTLQRIKLEGSQSDGRLGVWEGLMPRGAAPPLHSHPQDESLYVLEGELTAWLVPAELVDGDWAASCSSRLGVGSLLYAPGGVPHTFRVESDTARLLFLSTPAGVEEYVKALSEPARWPWLQPPPDGPRVPAERMREVEERLGMVRHGPPPPPAP
jgi:quercetin dioxygenase-like cupin family protein